MKAAITDLAKLLHLVEQTVTLSHLGPSQWTRPIVLACPGLYLQPRELEHLPKQT